MDWPCTDGTSTYDVSGSATVEADATGNCRLRSGVVATALAMALTTLPKVPADTSGTPTDTNPSGPPPVVTSSSPGPQPTPVPTQRRHRGSSTTAQLGGQKAAQTGSAGTVGLPPALPPAAVAAHPAAPPGLPLAPGLGVPGLTGGFAPSALGGASLPGGLSSGLFGASFGNPALLAGTPFGAAAASLYQPQADSAVTTVSHSEALATGAPRGIGTPTAIAAIALACIVGILVRSRILHRITRRELVGDPPLDEPVETDDVVAVHEAITTHRPVADVDRVLAA